MTKIAFLIHGYIGRVDGPVGTDYINNLENNNDKITKENELFIKIVTNHYKKFGYINNDNIDFFIHSWSYNQEELIKKYFKPRVIKTEKGIENSNTMNKWLNVIKSNGINGTSNNEREGYQASKRLHHIYALKKVWEIFEPYSDEYDIIIHARFSMCLHKPFSIDKLKPNMMYTLKLLNGTKGPYEHHIHGFFEDPIISTSIKGSKEYCDAINYLLDKNKYELWKKHDGHFNDSLNCVSAHRTTYHILHILKKYHNIDWDWIPDFIYTNHYHSSSFNFCRHLYFGHLDFNHRRGNDPMYDNMEQREILQLPENIELIKTFLL